MLFFGVLQFLIGNPINYFPGLFSCFGKLHKVRPKYSLKSDWRGSLQLLICY